MSKEALEDKQAKDLVDKCVLDVIHTAFEKSKVSPALFMGQVAGALWMCTKILCDPEFKGMLK